MAEIPTFDSPDREPLVRPLKPRNPLLVPLIITSFLGLSGAVYGLLTYSDLVVF